jgi:hypothetical protein
MNSYSIIIIILIIFFFIIFFSLLYINQNKIIGYRVIKEDIKKNINYNQLKDKYKITECNKMCKPELCDDYLNQKIKYDLCKECKKKMMCYDENNGCVPCIDFRSCNDLYGCNGGDLINPINNYCKKCW